MCYQYDPDSLLPEPLRNANPLRILQRVDDAPLVDSL